MIVQIAALSFIGVWIFWGYLDYRGHRGSGEIMISVLGGLLGAFATSFVLIIAALAVSAAMGYFS